MTTHIGLSCNDLKFYWKIHPIAQEEEKLRVLIASEECALKKIAQQREATNKANEKNEKITNSPIARVAKDDIQSSPTKKDDNRQETVLRLRCERRRKKLQSLHEEKLKILWSFVEEWTQLELNRLTLEPSRKNLKALSRLSFCYMLYPLVYWNEISSWSEFEHLQASNKCQCPDTAQKIESERFEAEIKHELNSGLTTIEEELETGDIDDCAALEDEVGGLAQSQENQASGNELVNDESTQDSSPAATDAEENYLDTNHTPEQNGEEVIVKKTTDVSIPEWKQQYMHKVKSLTCPWDDEHVERKDWEMALNLQIELEKEAVCIQYPGTYLDNGNVPTFGDGEECMENEDEEIKTLHFVLCEEANVSVCSDKVLPDGKSKPEKEENHPSSQETTVLVAKADENQSDQNAAVQFPHSSRFSENPIKKNLGHGLKEKKIILSDLEAWKIKGVQKNNVEDDKTQNTFSTHLSGDINFPNLDHAKKVFPPPGFKCTDQVKYLVAPTVSEVESIIDEVNTKISFVAELSPRRNDLKQLDGDKMLKIEGKLSTIVPSLNLQNLDSSTSEDETTEDVGTTYDRTIVLRDDKEHDIHSSNRTNKSKPQNPKEANRDQENPVVQVEKLPQKINPTGSIEKTGAQNAFDFTFNGGMLEGSLDTYPTPRYEGNIPPPHPNYPPGAFPTYGQTATHWPPFNQNDCKFTPRSANSIHPVYPHNGRYSATDTRFTSTGITNPAVNPPADHIPRPCNNVMNPSLQHQFPPPSRFPQQMSANEAASNHIKWMLNVGKAPRCPVRVPAPAPHSPSPGIGSLRGNIKAVQMAAIRRHINEGISAQQSLRHNSFFPPQRDFGVGTWSHQRQRICLVRPSCIEESKEITQPSAMQGESDIYQAGESIQTTNKGSQPGKQDKLTTEASNQNNTNEVYAPDSSKNQTLNFFPSSYVFDNNLGI